MRFFSILPVIAAAALGTWSVVGRHSIYHDTIVDLDEVTATSYDLQALAFSLTASNFAVESPVSLPPTWHFAATDKFGS